MDKNIDDILGKDFETIIDINPSIHCDCTDCGNTRVTGKCLLEEYYYKNYNQLLPQIHRDRIRNNINQENLRKRRGYIFTMTKVTLI